MYKRFGKSVELRNIYMEYVMQEVDFCLTLDRVYTQGLNEELGI